MKTYSLKPADITRQWYILDASEAPLGRVAARAATLLLGKGKPQFSKHIDCGDYVVIINTAQTVVTGNKEVAKMYYHHSHFPGGLRETSLKDQREKDPNALLWHAIRGMLPVNKLRDARLERLKLYPDANQAHHPQKPTLLSMKGTK